MVVVEVPCSLLVLDGRWSTGFSVVFDFCLFAEDGRLCWRWKDLLMTSLTEYKVAATIIFRLRSLSLVLNKKLRLSLNLSILTQKEAIANVKVPDKIVLVVRQNFGMLVAASVPRGLEEMTAQLNSLLN